MKTAIVIGATGLIGKSLVDRLAHCDHISKVIAVTRRPISLLPSKVENAVVDFERLGDFADKFKGDYLFSCLGTTLKQAGSAEAQRKVDLDYQYAAAEIAAKNGVSHYLLVSSSFANAESKNFYLKLKGELEQRVLMLPFTRISIFQPGLLLGEREKPRPGEKVAGLIMPVLNFIPGLRRYRPIRGDQVAQKMVETSRSPGPSREVFTLEEVFP